MTPANIILQQRLPTLSGFSGGEVAVAYAPARRAAPSVESLQVCHFFLPFCKNGITHFVEVRILTGLPFLFEFLT